MPSFFSKFQFQTSNELRFDTLVLIIYTYFMVLVIGNKDIDWAFHPFRDDIIADRIGLQFNKPDILPKFGLMFRFLTIVCNLFGFLPVFFPKRKFREFLMPVLIWNTFTITALLLNIFHMMVTIIFLQIPWKAVLSVGIAAGFVLAMYLKLILQVVIFYEYLQSIDRVKRSINKI